MAVRHVNHKKVWKTRKKITLRQKDKKKITSFCDGDGDDAKNGAEKNADVGDGDDVGVGSTAAPEDTRDDDTVDDRTDEDGIDNKDLPEEIFEDVGGIDDDANIAADDTINDDGREFEYLLFYNNRSISQLFESWVTENFRL